MPPRIRSRASKAVKENINCDNKVKATRNNTKAPRKPLADKTNSASDDTSVEVSKKSKKTVTKSTNVAVKENVDIHNNERPRRDRRLPSRFVENPVLTNLSNNKDSIVITPNNSAVNNSRTINSSPIKDSPVKSNEPEISPFKTPSKVETSLVVNRPRRICRLPSRFDDHSVSPSKYISIQPGNASTPIQLSKAKPTSVKENSNKELKKLDNMKSQTSLPARAAKSAALKKNTNTNLSSDKSSPDSNNNPKGKTNKTKKTQPQVLSPKIGPNQSSIRKFFNKTASPQLSPTKKVSPHLSNIKKIRDKNISFKVLGGKKRSQDDDNDLDIYEFTFDPDQEPKPQKKKRKKPAVKKPVQNAKPKAVVTYKSTYDQNISKALSALKKAVKPSKTAVPAKLAQIQETSDEVPGIEQRNNIVTNNISSHRENNVGIMNDTGKTSVHECNYPSIRVEDIAADIEPSIEHDDDLNYSPINSPRPQSPAVNPELDPRQIPERVTNNDPLNLQEDLSFFDDVPVASSSMNISVRHPLASPWRVEFGSLPIKWRSNTYVKPNMTPAVESSFICSEDYNKKKHVYTNMLPETNDLFSQTVSNTPNLKQTSIISFIKEIAEKKAKKKRGRSVSPTKAISYVSVEHNLSSKKQPEAVDNHPVPNNVSEEVVSSTNDTSNEKENSKEERKLRKRKNIENLCDMPAKSPRKQKDKNRTYFGFDDSENQDQENVSPTKVKMNARGRALRPRAALQEINGPTRAALPVAAKSKIATSSDAVNRVYEDLKSAADAPVFPEKNVENNVTNIEDACLDDDGQSVHLFEDIDVVHHLKPTRKSYGKAKKVTFRQHSTSDSESHEEVVCQNDQSSFEDDLADLTFEVPNVKEKKKNKKKRPKKMMSKKEEKEAEEWAAGFNSMCEEIEDFPLVVE